MEEPFVFSLCFKLSLLIHKRKQSLGCPLHQKVQRMHELSNLVRLWCEQEKGDTRQIDTRSHRKTPLPMPQLGGGNGTVVNFTAAESPQSSNNPHLQRG